MGKSNSRNSRMNFNPNSEDAMRGIFPLRVFNSGLRDPGNICFQRGTPILVADENTLIEKPIEDLIMATPENPLGGDCLISVLGTKTYPIAKVVGEMVDPPITIRATPISSNYEKEIEVTVSFHHTIVVSFSRAIQAYQLRKGDHIRTFYGDAIVNSLERPSSNNDFINIFLASGEFLDNCFKFLSDRRQLLNVLYNSSLGLQPKEHLMFGGGVLSGDLYIQMQCLESQSQGTSFISLT